LKKNTIFFIYTTITHTYFIILHPNYIQHENLTHSWILLNWYILYISQAQTIGKGAFGKVRVAKHILTN
jgi:hypothetical protein